ncbi:rRNA maturation RNase YbeY [Prolixibacter denitrificans]|uniref:Endoribonuclease YbeY n=1 Tax=Prolixibacter denitrificans TaxID=1541063 RepID=A0A2P8CHI7_9BACT|nr:rRNA maturation RNase YbeY [Prolixibacter denitrificans]PSK84372.1 rRNA maturation RNase YbeY [Prolixibacter denitrificans]GET20547.1 endoribonuclease YbeY [Prolixibacter denitrificans]
MNIQFYNEDVELPHLDIERVKKWLVFVAKKHEKEIGELSYIFCSDSYLLEVNRQYLSHDYLTDIITFDYTECDTVSGDVFISTERVADNAIEFNVSYDEELLRVLAHGILHLIGFNDKNENDQEEMTLQEDASILDYHNIEK